MLLCLVGTCQAQAQNAELALRLMWQVHDDASDEDLRLLAQTGISAIHSFNFGTWSEERTARYLERAATHRL
ncbi:MAG: hypothetical protein AB1634_19300, partial [Thermodesulfobacteriota bacterium]